MKAIILAAGVGRRLGLSEPKCLVEVGGRRVIDRQLSALRKAGVEQFVLVVGFEEDQVRRHLATQVGEFHYVVNERFESTNTLYSLHRAGEHIGGTFFYVNADVVFDRRLPQRLLAAEGSSALAVKRAACGPEEVKVVVEAGLVTRIGKELDPARCAGEFVGVARFDAALAEEFRWKLAACMEDEDAATAYFERLLDRHGVAWRMRAVDVTDLPCGEIDFPSDLVWARNELAARLLS